MRSLEFIFIYDTIHIADASITGSRVVISEPECAVARHSPAGRCCDF